ncbi:MAG: MopE-related protein [Myxococcales bacterium]|nr:MopE-related protein [Polyangiaceae bacterium]MDW8250324.1 MopE-related protein [Myxococcales bacterium]
MNTSLPWRRWFPMKKYRLLTLSMLAALAGSTGVTQAAEDPKCLSPNPADWPPPARPFFLVAFDTSGSMVACTNPTFASSGGLKPCISGVPSSAFNSCGLPPNRINDGKCAIRKMAQAFGEVDFGLITFPSNNSCAGAAAACGPYDVDGVLPERSGPGNRCTLLTKPGSIDCPGPGDPKGKLLVGLPVASDQVAKIVSYTDDVCNTGDPLELLPVGGTPLNGLLEFSATYLKNNIAQLQPSCRPINIILVTDGLESCEAITKVKETAKQIFSNSGDFAVGRPVKVFPVGFGLDEKIDEEKLALQVLEEVADEGQCSSSDVACRQKAKALRANNEAELSIALSQIITGAIQPETCDNIDNNCNGCTDEGFQHFCNRNKQSVTQCCNWATAASRNNCLTKYENTKDPKDLPCWDPANTPGGLQPQQAWLCVDPGELCDDKDNNCDVSTVVSELNSNTVDEGQKKCGSPLKCAAPNDTCIPGSTLGVDDDCDGIVDNAPGNSTPGSACPNNCVPSQEICDGKDNDCNGLPDDNVPEIPCGPPAGPGTAPNCQGTLKCVGGAYSNKCNVNPLPETCNGLDDDCDGKIDNGAPGTPCVPVALQNLKFKEDGFSSSQCKKGVRPCGAPSSVCGGFVGPSQEVCDGIDNDCDGDVDEGELPGVGAPCGTSQGACTPGQRACVGGTFICVGGTQPQPELCNGVDDDCDGIPDAQETIFDDAPAPDKNGCWTGLDLATCDPANVCSNPVKGPDWCKPAQADCSGVGSLKAPCFTGKLTCQSTPQGFAYVCKGGLVPSEEKCDGVDNNCDGQVDDGIQVDPKPCSTACGEGIEVCKDGKISCSAPTPKPEICNNVDDDCNGKIDDDVVQACSSECGSGVQVCKDGVFGPCTAPDKQAEICDGLDNDCDGIIDESVELDGTADPFDPSKVIGQLCGSDVGECKKGTWKCINGVVKCIGAITPQNEVCDGKDNDCDGIADNTSANNPLCDTSTKQECVKTEDGAQCASRCQPGEFPCPAGNYTCLATETSGATPEPGQYCVQPSGCKACETQTVKQIIGGKEQVLCAPSYPPGSTPVPLCVCKNNKCSPPCAGVLCEGPLVCTDFGEKPGSCVDSSCFTVPCSDGKICSPDAVCVENPCKPGSCKPDEVCKPSGGQATCIKSCAGVQCKEGEVCTAGECKATQCPKEGCGEGKVCDTTKGECVTAICKGCKAGQVCNPTTGQCEANPCDGVLCPEGERCEGGDCFDAPGQGSAGSAGSAGTGGGSPAGTGGEQGTAGISSGGTSSGISAGGGVTAISKPIGLTTGGGGCTCSTGIGIPGQATGALSLLLTTLPLLRRRFRGVSRKAASR